MPYQTLRTKKSFKRSTCFFTAARLRVVDKAVIVSYIDRSKQDSGAFDAPTRDPYLEWRRF